MVNRLFYVFIALTLFMVTGCTNGGQTNEVAEETIVSSSTSGSVDAEEVLTLDPNADIFQYGGVIYKTNIDWVEELTLIKEEQIGEIKAKNVDNTDFKDEMSNKLPIGAKIFSAKERGDILIVEFDGKILKYLVIVEG